MGVMDKFLNYMRLNDEDEDYYEDDEYLDEDDEPEVPARKSSPAKSSVKEDDSASEDKGVKKPPIQKVTPIRQSSAKRVPVGGMEVCVIKPGSFEEAREITETLLASRTVVLNLEGLDLDLAQRIIDFTSGSCFAINGNFQKISNYIFIITPASVDISGDFQDILGGAFDSPLSTGY